MSRSLQEREWDAEKEQLRKTEAQNHFLSLLVDLVKDPQSSWTDTRRQLKKDQRWELSEHIEISDKEKMFRDHISKLAKKRRLQFRKLLEETPKVYSTYTLGNSNKSNNVYTFSFIMITRIFLLLKRIPNFKISSLSLSLSRR